MYKPVGAAINKMAPIYILPKVRCRFKFLRRMYFMKFSGQKQLPAYLQKCERKMQVAR